MSTSTLTPFANRNFSRSGAEILFGAAPPRPPRDPDSWQKLIGEKPIGARLDMLPERQTNWRALATSTFTQVSIVVVLVLLQIFIPEKLITTIEYNVMPLAGPMIEIPKAKPQPVRPKPLPTPAPQPVPQHAPKLIAPRMTPVVLKAKPVDVRPVEVPKVEQAAVMPNLSVPDSGPVRPIEVKTGVLGDSPAGGGFGDPHGLPGAADPSKRVNIAHVGGFDNEVGPGYGSGSGNGTGYGGNGGRGNGNGVAGAGFGGGAAFATGKSEGPKAVEKSGFQNAELVAQTAKPKSAAPEAPQPSSVELLSKPNPQYTDEARRLGIEGEVLVNVVFLASGQIKVEGISKGLGHGLDESAIRAAQQIRFKPAMQDGHAVDFPAVIHIVFQVAF